MNNRFSKPPKTPAAKVPQAPATRRKVAAKPSAKPAAGKNPTFADYLAAPRIR